MMKSSLSLLLALVLSLSMSALGSSCSSDTDVAVSNVARISSITLGTLQRRLATRTADGSRDSIAISQFSASAYTLTIDTLRLLIANTDSLPYGTNLRKVKIGAFNATGTSTIRSLYTGKDSTFNTADSIDFSQPRTISIYSTDGTTRRDYTVTLIAHQQNADSVKWSALTASQWAALDIDTTRSTTLEAGKQFFRFTDTDIYRSADGTTWQNDTIETENRAFLPTTGRSFVAMESRGNSRLLEAYLYGTQRSASGNVESRLWKRSIDLDGRYNDPWIYLDSKGLTTKIAPALAQASLLAYDDGLLLIGLDSQRTLRLYFSADRGRTWGAHSTLALPENFANVNHSFATVDANNFLYIAIDGAKFWRGRINRLGWAQ